LHYSVLLILGLLKSFPLLIPSDRIRHGVKTGRFISCKKDTEYLHNGICCSKCEAGQYVQTPCTETGTKGTCEECDYGTFTEHANGLKQCIKCTQCPPDQEIVRVCSHTQDTLCRCKPGRYCHPDEACEICKKCSRCNGDEEVVKNCTSTSNTECKKLPGITSPEAGSFLFKTFPQISVANTAAPPSFSPTNSPTLAYLNMLPPHYLQGCISVSKPHGTKPSTYANIYKPQGKEETINLHESNPSSASSSQHNLTDPAETLPWEDPNRRVFEASSPLFPGVESLVACFEFFEELNVDFHNRFFRKLSIEDNEIRSKDHLSHEDRIHYLLSYWVEKKGKEASLNHLLRALLDLNQRRTAETVMEKSIQKGFYELESLSVGDN
uniref:Hematopoietic death receptor n=1 Tax=Xiphophorus couchianus TaxID=32473 RepID=A0A3B5M987_9TELE